MDHNVSQTFLVKLALPNDLDNPRLVPGVSNANSIVGILKDFEKFSDSGYENQTF